MSLLAKVSWAAVKRLIRLQFPQVKSISPAELATWIEQDTRPILLDVRTPEEYQVSHLPNALLASDDINQLQQELQKHLQNDNGTGKAIVAYCSVGYRSAKLVDQLQKLGYDHVFNLEGSIFAWANHGYPVYCDGQIVNQVHPYNDRWGQLLRSDLRFSLRSNVS